MQKLFRNIVLFGITCTLLLALLLDLESCRKADGLTPAVSETEEVAEGRIISVDEAISFFNNSIPDQRHARSSGNNHIGQPAWKRIYPVAVQGGEGILKVALEGYPLDLGYRDLLFQQQPDGSVNYVVLEVRPDSSYLSGKVAASSGEIRGMRYYMDNADFTGDILYFNPQTNQFLKGWRYKEGQPKYTLKQVKNADLSRGLPKDDDTPGWSGTGNNTDGYDIDEVVIPAPAPPNHNPPPYIPPVNDSPGSINPPNHPIGGGSGNMGGNGKPPEDIKDGEDYNGVDATGIKSICPNSFKFTKVVSTDQGGGWQVAAVKYVHMNVVDFNTGQIVPVYPGTTIYFGMPVIRSNGEFYSPARAAELAVIAMDKAERTVMDKYYANPNKGLDIVGMGAYFRDEINKEMSKFGGRATLTSGTNIRVTPTTAQYSGIFGYGCK